jgi:hypothetical protein
MGYKDASANLRVLCETNGDVFKAVALLNSSAGASMVIVLVIALQVLEECYALFSGAYLACCIIVLSTVCWLE